MFKEEREELQFDWSMLGDIGDGRPNLGMTMYVAVYRLMQFTLRDVLIKNLGVEKANKVFFEAGKRAGEELYRHCLTGCRDFAELSVRLQENLRDLKIGILRFEHSEVDKGEFVITVAEDLDCSGLPFSAETICIYDEGFLSGILGEYFGRPFDVREVDCWCSGDRICRFEAKASD